jgi:hypothetical protein
MDTHSFPRPFCADPGKRPVLRERIRRILGYQRAIGSMVLGWSASANAAFFHLLWIF